VDSDVSVWGEERAEGDGDAGGRVGMREECDVDLVEWC